ncbi:MAG: hypothetical protein ABIQ89_04570 [Candidatus Saccharimonadales bacterium]
MARLPQPGGDKGSWGDVLNDFLSVAHNSDGSIKSDSFDTSGAALKSSNLADLSSIATAKTNLGLDQVNNTSDANKPVSTATQIAINAKLSKAGDTMSGNIVMGNNKITGLADGIADADVPNVAQLAAAIAASETDLATVGTEITDLPTALRTDSTWATSYPTDQNFVPIVQNGVAKKMPLELMTTMAPAGAGSASGTTYTWSSGENTIVCSNSSPLTLTLPTFASAPGIHGPVRVMRLGTGAVTISPGSSVIINKAASLPLTLRQQYSVAYFWLYFWTGGTTVYLAWGDLG